ncbi:MAG TPA: D-alanine--D-alanine ligase [Candidatus Desulfofervidus auxilii]|uniref:D-alanine--D-alanine ligase n=1 Tax=Desulfofervidus auxilii TaxID=1621989 RepID=A0A7C0U265_DESA2|nr:D-alanine--D-alanine ligase [Candidatus Desulfofervidus auxilii]
MKKLTIALLCGGKSNEREISLKSCTQVKNALPKEKYEVIIYDPATDIPKLVQDASKIDVALIMLHGRYGEDGTIQGLLDLLGIPYQCSGVLASALAMNKIMAKRIFRSVGLKVPRDIVISHYEKYDLNYIIDMLGLPLIVKPSDGGSSIALSLVENKEELNSAIEIAFKESETILIEEYVKGREITGGVLGNRELLALPIVEIIPQGKHTFFDYEAKYVPGVTKEICPALLPPHLTEKAKKCAITAHKALGCKGYSRTDMILKDEDIYVLEINTIPGMTETSLFPLAAKKLGISFTQLLEKLINLALESAYER